MPPRLLLASSILLAACFSGVKYARESETCKSGDQVFEGSVSCADGLRCLTTARYRENYREGVCLTACGPGAPCGSGTVCAAGVCLAPCVPGETSCPGYYDVCCRSRVPGEPAACVWPAACEEWGLLPDAGTPGGPPEVGP